MWCKYQNALVYKTCTITVFSSPNIAMCKKLCEIKVLLIDNQPLSCVLLQLVFNSTGSCSELYVYSRYIFGAVQKCN